MIILLITLFMLFTIMLLLTNFNLIIAFFVLAVFLVGLLYNVNDTVNSLSEKIIYLHTKMEFLIDRYLNANLKYNEVEEELLKEHIDRTLEESISHSIHVFKEDLDYLANETKKNFKDLNKVDEKDFEFYFYSVFEDHLKEKNKPENIYETFKEKKLKDEEIERINAKKTTTKYDHILSMTRDELVQDLKKDIDNR